MDDWFVSGGPDVDQSYSLSELIEVGQNITYESPFAMFDLNLNEEDMHVINNLFSYDQLKFKDPQEPTYRLYGFDLEKSPSFLRQDIHDHLTFYSSNDHAILSKVSDIITKVLSGVANSLGEQYEAYMRLLPYTEGVKSWHVDGIESEVKCPASPEGYSYTFLSVLKGPSTLFYVPSVEMEEELAKIIPDFNGRHYGNINYAEKFNELAESKFVNNTFSAPYGYGTIHLDGNELGTIHSAPQYNEERLLLLINIEKKGVSDNKAKGPDPFCCPMPA